MKDGMGMLTSRLDAPRERVAALEDISVEVSKAEKQTVKRLEKKKERKQNRKIHDLRNSYKRCNIHIIHIIEIPEEEINEQKKYLR